MEETRKNFYDGVRAWYVVACISGREYSVKANLEQRIISNNLQDYIFQILIPEKVEKVRNRKGEIIEKRSRYSPGYIYVEMDCTDDAWFIVRNTPDVIGILGSSGGGTKPIPLEPEEIAPILQLCGVELELHLDFEVGDIVQVINGPYANQELEVTSINKENQKVTVLVDLFGMKIEQELDLSDVVSLKK